MHLLLSAFKWRTKTIHYKTLPVCLWNSVSKALISNGQMSFLFITGLCHCLPTSQNAPFEHKHFLLIKNVFKRDRLWTGAKYILLNIFMAINFVTHTWKCKALQFVLSSPETLTSPVCQSRVDFVYKMNTVRSHPSSYARMGWKKCCCDDPTSDKQSSANISKILHRKGKLVIVCFMQDCKVNILQKGKDIYWLK